MDEQRKLRPHPALLDCLKAANMFRTPLHISPVKGPSNNFVTLHTAYGGTYLGTVVSMSPGEAT